VVEGRELQRWKPEERRMLEARAKLSLEAALK
jgi:hypothetical protein